MICIFADNVAHKTRFFVYVSRTDVVDADFIKGSWIDDFDTVVEQFGQENVTNTTCTLPKRNNLFVVIGIKYLSGNIYFEVYSV